MGMSMSSVNLEAVMLTVLVSEEVPTSSRGREWRESSKGLLRCIRNTRVDNESIWIGVLGGSWTIVAETRNSSEENIVRTRKERARSCGTGTYE